MQKLEVLFGIPRRIIVEDDMAQSIVKRVLEEEELKPMISVEFYPGGCSNLKKYTILTYARTSIKNQYIIFDGDQYMEKVPNFDLILEKAKTLSFYRECFQQVVGIRSSNDGLGVGCQSRRRTFK